MCRAVYLCPGWKDLADGRFWKGPEWLSLETRVCWKHRGTLSVLVSVLNSWWPSGFVWSSGGRRCYVWGVWGVVPSLIAYCVDLLDYLMFSCSQCHAFVLRGKIVFPECYTLASSALSWNLCSFVFPPEVPCFSHCCIWLFSETQRNTLCKMPLDIMVCFLFFCFLPSLVFQQHFRTLPQNKMPNVYVDSPLNLTGVGSYLRA